MTVTEKTGGSQTATIETEHTLATITDAGVYVLVVDTANMVAGDVLRLKIKTKARTGGTSRLAYSAVYAHAQGDSNKYSVPVPVTTELIATLEQTDGTGRAFPWSVYSL
jgi:hypothetical protein